MLYPFKARKLGAFVAHVRKRVSFSLWRHLRVSFAHETSINSERLENRSIFFLPLTHSGRRSLTKKGFSVQSCAIFGVTFLVISKNNTRIGRSVKRESNNKTDSEDGRALHSIPFFNDRRQEWVRGRKKMYRFCNLSLFVLISRVNETLRWRHKVN